MYPDLKIFTLFDQIHFIKNVRNCFYNRGKLLYVDWETMNTHKTAKWNDYTELYNSEAGSVLRKAPALTVAAINPTNFVK